MGMEKLEFTELTENDVRHHIKDLERLHREQRYWPCLAEMATCMIRFENMFGENND